MEDIKKASGGLRKMARCNNMKYILTENIINATGKCNCILACIGDSCSKKHDKFVIDTICFQKGL